MNNMNTPHFANNGQVDPVASIDLASPYHNLEVAFHWKNVDYPSLHTHEHWEIFVVMQGEIMHTINGQKYLCKRGDAWLIRPNDLHELHFSSNASQNYQNINFIFSSQFAEQLLRPHRDPNELNNAQRPLSFSINESDLNSIYDKCLYTQNLPKEQYEASAKLLVAQLMLIFLEQDTVFDLRYPVWFNNFLIYVSTPSNFDLSLKELSQATPYSYSRLAVLFKEYTGITFASYVTEKKLTYAKQLLRTTSMTTLQISEKLGYTSLSAFNHLFKKTFSMTPSEYRKKHK
jgi:AraC family cel operon transcriptional repressor